MRLASLERLVEAGALLALLAAAACAPTQVAISARFPANYPAAAELRRITVAEFDGRGSQTFTAQLRNELTNAVFDGQRHFTILSDDNSVRDAVQAARRAGAAAVVMGDTSVNIGQDNYTAARRECVARDDDNDCVRWHEYQVPCVSRTVNVTATPRMVRASDGQVIYSNQRSSALNSRWCSDQTRNTNDDAMVMQAFANVAVMVRRDIAPYNAVVHATVKASHEGLPRELASRFDLAVAAVNANNIAGACQIWGEVDAANPNHVWTVYNLGICAEATGDYPGAMAQYQRAWQLGGAADRAVNDSVARVNRLLTAEQQLAVEEARERAVADARARVQREAAERASAAERAAQAERAARRADNVRRWGPAMADAILAGRVEVGMTQEQVRASRGAPTQVEQLTTTDAIWHYGGQRVMFANGRVTAVRN